MITIIAQSVHVFARLSGSGHPVVEARIGLEDHQAEQVLNELWSCYGDEWLKKRLVSEGYDLFTPGDDR